MILIDRGYPKPVLIFLILIVIYFIHNFCHPSFTHKNLYNKPSPRLIEVFQSQANERRAWMNLINNSMEILQWGFLYNNLAPEVYCAEKVKVGSTDDGGKWMCSPFNLPDGCIIFALGINNAISFESHIQKLSNQRCKIISVDSGKQSNETISTMKSIGGNVINATIGNENMGETRTMESILTENGVNEVEILKIDIEGSEFGVMPSFLHKYTVSQIMIEVHGDPPRILEFLREFGQKGYLLYHYEINGRDHRFCEYGFIHESRLERYEATLLAKYL